MAEMDAALTAKTSALSERWRPPVGVGALLVFAGFVLQMIGSWPH